MVIKGVTPLAVYRLVGEIISWIARLVNVSFRCLPSCAGVRYMSVAHSRATAMGRMQVCIRVSKRHPHYFSSDWALVVLLTLPSVSVLALFALRSGASGLSTAASKSSILRSKAVSCDSIADAVLSPLAAKGSGVSWVGITVGCRRGGKKHTLLVLEKSMDEDEGKQRCRCGGKS